MSSLFSLLRYIHKVKNISAPTRLNSQHFGTLTPDSGGLLLRVAAVVRLRNRSEERSTFYSRNWDWIWIRAESNATRFYSSSGSNSVLDSLHRRWQQIPKHRHTSFVQFWHLAAEKANQKCYCDLADLNMSHSMSRGRLFVGEGFRAPTMNWFTSSQGTFVTCQ